MSNIFIVILSTAGALFILLAAIGFVRMPDAYLRISVTTKAVTLGVGLILISAAIYFEDLSITSRVLAIILFIILTAPVGAHLIGRASYLMKVSMWKKTTLDELEGKYNELTHELRSDDIKKDKEEENKKE
ncbi:multicomponent Na+:H+ antiporter subunit G [Mesonia hippocampi]|uniref:Multicomponent Na+:H+ antiporter subunit G n=1 Tax=Mesonia hippocampi TaxID=1628250 RepID=A0A840EQR1_9FLAO|nr:monovalent cation/H(+) antiporter subunit G [Mesonia hippocampi]MBB4119300.1 multicomponent Na+:H+ antiporter subunit G [Mesonia hippocampi]